MQTALNESSTSHIEWRLDVPRVVSKADPFLLRIPQMPKIEDKFFLATRALRQDPGCIEALRLLAAYSEGNHQLRLLQGAVKAGDTLWMPVAEEYGCHARWWDWAATRPWMHAILELGEAHAERDNTLAAKWCFQRLLDLNPANHQGVERYLERLQDNVEVMEIGYR